MLAPPLTLDQALARGELLAADTTESTHVIRVGEWVYKFLRPYDSFPQKTARRRRQCNLRVIESHRHPELNPLEYCPVSHTLISKFIDGRSASTKESEALCRLFLDSRRGYVVDLSPPNIVIAADGPVVIDFEIADHHPNWLASRPPITFRLEQDDGLRA